MPQFDPGGDRTEVRLYRLLAPLESARCNQDKDWPCAQALLDYLFFRNEDVLDPTSNEKKEELWTALRNRTK